MSHWGAFAADVDAVRRGHSRAAGRAGPRTVAAARQLRRRAATPAARRRADGAPRVGWSAGPGPDVARGTDEFVAVGWDEVLDRLAAELDPGVRRAGAGGGVRRLLRLVERRALPPRPEPGTPVPEQPRRLRPLGEHLQHRHVRGGAAADLRPPGRPAALVHRVAADRRAHRAARVLRRHPGQEPRGGARRRHPAPLRRPPHRDGAPRRRGGAGGPGPGRPAPPGSRPGGCRCGPAPTSR